MTGVLGWSLFQILIGDWFRSCAMETSVSHLANKLPRLNASDSGSEQILIRKLYFFSYVAENLHFLHEISTRLPGAFHTFRGVSAVTPQTPQPTNHPPHPSNNQRV
jgi:hypothetical protein